MGCSVSRLETEEGGNGRRGELRMIIRRRSIRGGVVADSFTLDEQLLENPARSKGSKPNGCAAEKMETKANKEDNVASNNRDANGDHPENSILLSPGSPSFRIYCPLPDPLNPDSDAYDTSGCVGPSCELRRNKCETYDKKVRRQEARGGRIGRGFKSWRRLLINQVASGDEKVQQKPETAETTKNSPEKKENAKKQCT